MPFCLSSPILRSLPTVLLTSPLASWLLAGCFCFWRKAYLSLGSVWLPTYLCSTKIHDQIRYYSCLTFVGGFQGSLPWLVPQDHTVLSWFQDEKLGFRFVYVLPKLYRATSVLHPGLWILTPEIMCWTKLTVIILFCLRSRWDNVMIVGLLPLPSAFDLVVVTHSPHSHQGLQCWEVLMCQALH